MVSIVQRLVSRDSSNMAVERNESCSKELKNEGGEVYRHSSREAEMRLMTI